MISIETQLCADATEVEVRFGEVASLGGDTLVLFSLGIAPEAFVPFAWTTASETTVLCADCYGILGYSPAAGRNLELMEAGRGQEYGGVGGSGGQGVVAVRFSGARFEPSVDALPGRGRAHLAVAGAGGDVSALLRERATAPYFGGLAKRCYQYQRERNGFEEVPHFFVTDRESCGTTSFTSEATDALRELLAALPAGEEVEAVALFPCFMRGINEYGRDNVEPDALAELLPGVPVYGMFCHGELGPRRCLGFALTEPVHMDCGQHSMTSIVAIHARVVG